MEFGEEGKGKALAGDVGGTAQPIKENEYLGTGVSEDEEYVPYRKRLRKQRLCRAKWALVEHFPYRFALLTVVLLLMCLWGGVDLAALVSHVGAVQPTVEHTGTVGSLVTLSLIVALFLAAVNLFSGVITDPLKEWLIGKM